MCLIALAIGNDARWPLVIAANRDEAHARPTQALSWWRTPDGTDILGGKDLLDGGVWMAQNRAGRLAMLTNVRQGLPGRGARSRGELGLAWLSRADVDVQRFMREHRAADYGGCNITLADDGQQQWWWLSNRDAHGQALDEWSLQAIAPGVHTISNAQWNTPWPKAEQLRAALQAALRDSASRADLQARLLHALSQDGLPAGALPDTGVGPEAETALAPVFIRWAAHGYGTRTSTVVVAEGAQLHWLERRFDAQGQISTEGDTGLTAPQG